MKKLVLLVITFLSISVYAQKKEVKSAEKLLKKEQISEAKDMIDQACKLKDQADNKTKARILFAKGEIYAKSGLGNMADYTTAVNAFKALKALEKETGKDKYSEKADQAIANIVNGVLKKGTAFYKNKKYAAAGAAFDLAYQASNSEDYLYNAGISYLLGKDYDKALPIMQKMYKSGYTGQNDYYVATNKETGKEETFSNESMAKLSVKAGTHTNFAKKQSESKRSDIIANILYIYNKTNKEDDAIKFIEEAKKEDPDNIDLIIGEGNYYLKKGDNVKFAQAMQKAVEKEPNNKIFNFNLATAYYQLNKYSEAKKYYEKTIELDPKYADAYKGLAYIVLAPEKELTKKMNTDKVMMNDNLFNKYKKQQLDLYKKVYPILEKALQMAPKDMEVVSMLKTIYNELEMKDKFKKMKDLFLELKSQK